jgi:colicin import membrane protein
VVQNKGSYFFSGSLALVLHGLMAGLLSWSSSTTWDAAATSSAVPAIEATVAATPAHSTLAAITISDQALQAEMARLTQQQLAKEQEAAATKKALQAEKEQWVKARQAEEQRVKALTQKHQAMQAKQAKEAAASAARLKAEQAQVARLQQQAEQLKQQEMAAQKQQAEEKKRQAEENKRQAEEKKRQEQRLAEQAALARQQQAREAQAKAQAEAARASEVIKGQIEQHWRKPLEMHALQGRKCHIAVSLAKNGEVKAVKVVKSSGNVEFDRSTVMAVQKASPLSLPQDPKLREEFQEFSFTFSEPEMV